MSNLISRIAARTRTTEKDVNTFIFFSILMTAFFSSIWIDQAYYGGPLEPLRGLSRIETMKGWESVKDANPEVHESLLWGYVVKTDERVYLTSLSSTPELLQTLEQHAR